MTEPSGTAWIDVSVTVRHGMPHRPYKSLDLSAVRAGRYDMICLPVKLHGSDGAPARAILRPIT